MTKVLGQAFGSCPRKPQRSSLKRMGAAVDRGPTTAPPVVRVSRVIIISTSVWNGEVTTM